LLIMSTMLSLILMHFLSLMPFIPMIFCHQRKRETEK
jgi:hypothetical protein